MMRMATLIIAARLCSTAAAPLVMYQSPCECLDNHGKHRSEEKNDPAVPPTDASAIQAVTPSENGQDMRFQILVLSRFLHGLAQPAVIGVAQKDPPKSILSWGWYSYCSLNSVTVTVP